MDLIHLRAALILYASLNLEFKGVPVLATKGLGMTYKREILHSGKFPDWNVDYSGYFQTKIFMSDPHADSAGFSILHKYNTMTSREALFKENRVKLFPLYFRLFFGNNIIFSCDFVLSKDPMTNALKIMTALNSEQILNLTVRLACPDLLATPPET